MTDRRTIQTLVHDTEDIAKRVRELMRGVYTDVDYDELEEAIVSLVSASGHLRHAIATPHPALGRDDD